MGLNTSLIRQTGIIGLLAASIDAISDLFTQYSSNGFGLITFHFAVIPQWRLAIGYYLGILSIPFLIVGHWHIFQGLAQQPRLRQLPLVIFLISSYITIIGTSYHATLTILIVSAAVQTRFILFDLYTAPLAIFVFCGYTIVSCLFIIAVIFGNGRYPRWFALCSPLLQSAVIVLISVMIPFLGRFLFPLLFTLPQLLLFLISLTMLWKDGDAN